MKTALFQCKSEIDLKLIMQLAEKLGVKSAILSESELEEIGLVNTIRKGRSGEFVDLEEFIEKLR